MDDNEIPDNNPLENLVDGITTLATGIPAPLRKNFWKAVGQLCTAAVDVPVSYFEGQSALRRANTESRVQLIKRISDDMTDKISVPEIYSDLAIEKHASKIIRFQGNLDQITHQAANIIITNDSITDDIDEISEEWLNEFEQNAQTKSSDEMRLIFSRLLAGEISQPGSFSIRTIKTLSEFDQNIALKFRNLCSLCITIKDNEKVIAGNIPYFDSLDTYLKTLSRYEISYEDLILLNEAGMITADFHTKISYGSSVINSVEKLPVRFFYNNKRYLLEPIAKNGSYDDDILNLLGISLTSSGKELYNLVDIVENFDFSKDLNYYMNSKGLNIIEI
ncbi:DUF2806 domain-containing protein [Chryseobacterium wangxinyae]|uniref:DUF2806 domain-containing protein n=1 Tax=Chryseobacterium sp. CY353 TaxID=2997334 RepID=UPI00226F9C54|nr:DUF2806 domain-containing protein [Chryseobacterium sp. CY353]MCY0967905.1 DUF2806 domain-containing protein [Chryseobacterium sp. CY353]